MSDWFIIDIAVFMVVMTLTGIIIPQILLIAFRKNLYDEVNPRKVHSGSIPRLGGIAFFPSILFAILLVFGIGAYYFPKQILSIPPTDITSLCFVCCAVIVLYLVGMADDLIGLRYRAKFMAQIFCACLIFVGGLSLNNLHGFLGIHTMPVIVDLGLTILLTVFITNALNLIDGIDGLASGLSAVACAFYGMIYVEAGDQAYALLSFATLGAMVPFFYYNVFGNAKKHSKIFMGDTGSLTVGLILSVLSIHICQLDASKLKANAAVVAIAPLLIPCFDVVRVYVHRIHCHRNPFLPDRSHIHHKLLALGMSQRVAMPTIVGTGIVLTAANYWFSTFVNINILFAIDAVLWIVANILISKAIRRRAKRTGIILWE